MEQGTKEWLQARSGRFTASEMWKLLTQPRAKKDKEAGLLSGTAKTYVLEKVQERITGQPRPEVYSKSLEWGKEQEPYAVELYEELTGRKIHSTGFIENNEVGLVGASVDGLLSYDTIAEIKCPYAAFIDRCLEDVVENSQYYVQIQTGLWVTNRSSCEYIIFDPRMPKGKQMVIQRIGRDEAKINEIKAAVKNAEEWAKRYMKEIESKFEETLKFKI